jgi:hypothetical protein
MQVEVHHGDVGLNGYVPLHPFLSVCGLPANLPFSKRFQQMTKLEAHGMMVIGDENSRHT